MSEIYNRFRNTIQHYQMIAPGDRVLLSLSAGKDSMAMLSFMHRLKEEIDFETGIFHLNHLTRSDESDADEALVCKKAYELGIPCYAMRHDFTLKMGKGISFEEMAREVRYSMLDEIASQHKFNKIATAHNRTDNVETLLMRIFTGTGLQGLRGIRYTTGKLIRPMLDLYPAEIYSFLEKNCIEWREDKSNSDSSYLRNYVRNELLPLIIRRFPDACDNIVNLAGRAGENESLIEYLAAKVHPGEISEVEGGCFLVTEGYSGNQAFIKYMISRLLHSRFGVNLNSSIYSEILRKFEEGKANLPLYSRGNLSIEKRLINGRAGILILQQSVPAACGDWEYLLDLSDCETKLYIPEINRFLNIKKTGMDEFRRSRGDRDKVFLDIPGSATVVKIRNRRNGDRILLETGMKKIKELMIEKKLDINTKKRVPLIVVDEEIAAYLPGAVMAHSDRVSCNFWVRNLSQNLFLLYFTDN